MSRSIGRLPEKERRAARRRNHIAKDLKSNKYQQKVKPSKKRKSYFDAEEEYTTEEFDFYRKGGEVD
jgi:hypothetical protein